MSIPIHSSVFFDVSIGGASPIRIEMDLYGNTPKTSENFRALCTGERASANLASLSITRAAASTESSLTSWRKVVTSQLETALVANLSTE